MTGPGGADGRTLRTAVVGAVVLDHLLYLADGSGEGSPRFVDSVVDCVGGKGLVTAVALQRLGCTPLLLGLVGRDSAVATAVPDGLRPHLVDVLDRDHEAWISVSGGEVVLSQVRLGRRLAGRPLPDAEPLVRGADVAYVAHEDPMLIRGVVEAATAAGAVVVTNLSTPLLHAVRDLPDLLGVLLECSDVLVMNEEEATLALAAAGARNWDEIGSTRLQEVVVTAGAAGGWVTDRPFGRRRHFSAVEAAEVLTPVGAGDTFSAGYLHARFALGLDALASCDAAAAIAAEKVGVASSSLADTAAAAPPRSAQGGAGEESPRSVS